MSRLTPGLLESIEKGWPCGFFVWIDHPDGEIFAWDGPRSFKVPAGHTGDAKFDGRTFTGVGPVGRIEGLGGSKQLRIQVVRLVISGLPDFADRWLNPQIHGAPAKVWEAGFKPDGLRLNGQPYLWMDGEVDYDELQVSDGQTEIVANIVPAFIELEAPQNPTYNPEMLNRVYGDGVNRLRGLDLLHKVPTADIVWTPS